MKHSGQENFAAGLENQKLWSHVLCTQPYSILGCINNLLQTGERMFTDISKCVFFLLGNKSRWSLRETRFLRSRPENRRYCSWKSCFLCWAFRLVRLCVVEISKSHDAKTQFKLISREEICHKSKYSRKNYYAMTGTISNNFFSSQTLLNFAHLHFRCVSSEIVFANSPDEAPKNSKTHFSFCR